MFILQVNSIAPSDFSGKPQAPLSFSSALRRHPVLREGPPRQLLSARHLASVVTLTSLLPGHLQVPSCHRPGAPLQRGPLSGPDHSQLWRHPSEGRKTPRATFPRDSLPKVPTAANCPWLREGPLLLLLTWVPEWPVDTAPSQGRRRKEVQWLRPT